MKKIMKNNQKGSAIVIIVVLALVFAIGAFLSYRMFIVKPTELSSTARDMKRETDIRIIHEQIEYFYKDNGYYPSTENLRNKDWTDENIPGLASTSLSDTSGIRIGNEDSEYSYTPAPEDCTECESYRLKVTLDDGSELLKISSN